MLDAGREPGKSQGRHLGARVLGVMLILGAAGLVGARCGDGGTHVGSRSCEEIGKATPDPATHDACSRCQGRMCGESGCDIFPCVEGARIVQGCQADADCSAFSGTRCGRQSAPDLVCSSHPDDR